MPMPYSAPEYDAETLKPIAYDLDLAKSYMEHDRVVIAILRGDRSGATEAMRAHIRTVREEYEAYLQAFGGANRAGYSATISTILFALLVLLTVFQLTVLERRVHYR